jgi:hypothetical protein
MMRAVEPQEVSPSIRINTVMPRPNSAVTVRSRKKMGKARSRSVKRIRMLSMVPPA